VKTVICALITHDFSALFCLPLVRRGKYFIQLCGTTPCMVCGSEDIKKTIMSHLVRACAPAPTPGFQSA